MAPATVWKELKRIVVGQNAIKSLKSLDPKSLKSLRNAHGKNLLHVTAKRAFLDISKYLIDAGVDMILEEKKNGHTPLSYALNCSDKKRKKIIDVLVKSGADISWNKIKRHSKIFKDPKIGANLFCALKSREGSFQAAVDHLLVNGHWSLDNIACLQNEIITKCALSRDHMLTENYEKLKDALNQQDVLKVKHILQFVSHSKRILSWALMEATRIRSPQSTIIIKLLLDHGASVDGFADDKRSPLVEALINRNVDNSWVLLDHASKSERDKIDNMKHIKEFYYYQTPWIPEEKRKKERVFAKNCIRLLIEHRGVCNCEDLRSGFPNFLRNYYNNFICGLCIKQHICKDYALLQRHLAAKDFSDIDNNSCCSDELERLKNYKVEDCPNLWNILSKTIDQVVPLTRNELLMNIISTKSFIKMFPHYGKALQFKVHKALQKRLLIDHSITVLKKCLPPCIGSCYLVLERIICYLGVPNLLCFEENNFEKRL